VGLVEIGLPVNIFLVLLEQTTPGVVGFVLGCFFGLGLGIIGLLRERPKKTRNIGVLY
jgi:hypothetical protein